MEVQFPGVVVVVRLYVTVWDELVVLFNKSFIVVAMLFVKVSPVILGLFVADQFIVPV